MKLKATYVHEELFEHFLLSPADRAVVDICHGETNRHGTVGGSALLKRCKPLPAAVRGLDGHQPFVWCALDAAEMPARLGIDATVRSQCCTCQQELTIAYRAGTVTQARPTEICLTNGRIVHISLFGLDLVLESMGRFLLGNRLSPLAARAMSFFLDLGVDSRV